MLLRSKLIAVISLFLASVTVLSPVFAQTKSAVKTSTDPSQAWQEFPATVTTANGASVDSVARVRIAQIGKTVFVAGTVSIKDVGSSGGNNIIVSLPAGFKPGHPAIGSAYEKSINGAVGAAIITANDPRVYLRSNSGSIVVKGGNIDFSVFYELP